MTKIKISILVALCVINGSMSADDSLANALKNGKFNTELRAWYYDRDTDDANPSTYTNRTVGRGDATILNFAVILGYESLPFYGFSIGATMQSSYAPWANDEAKNLFGADMYGSGAVLSEAFLKYAYSKSAIKVGRQFISTPMINGSGSRIVRQSFQGVTFTSNDVADTILFAAYIDKYQGRTKRATNPNLKGSDSDAPDFEKNINLAKGGGSRLGGVALSNIGYFDGAYSGFIRNKSIQNLTLSAQYLRLNDYARLGDIDAYYAEANYIIPFESLKFAGDFIYFKSHASDRLSGYDISGDHFGFKIGVKDFNGLSLTALYGKTSKDDAVVIGLGNSPTVYTATPVRGPGTALEKHTDSYGMELIYNLKNIGVDGLKFSSYYVRNNQNDIDTGSKIEDIKIDTYYVGFKYDVPSFKGLSLVAEFEKQAKKYEISNDATIDEMRVKVNYKF